MMERATLWMRTGGAMTNEERWAAVWSRAETDWSVLDELGKLADQIAERSGVLESYDPTWRECPACEMKSVVVIAGHSFELGGEPGRWTIEDHARTCEARILERDGQQGLWE